MIELLSGHAAADLVQQPLTYGPVGLSAHLPPPGYAGFVRTRHLPAGPSFAQRCAALLGWQVQARSGLRVRASAARVELDAVVLMRFGVGPAALTIPCRVVSVIDEDDRQGFAYGTLPGHPESGEEAFVLHRDGAGRVAFTISAVSRPATALARLGGPITSWVQRRMTDRYLTALD